MAVATKTKPVAAKAAPVSRTVTRAAPVVAEAPRAERPTNVPKNRAVAMGRDGKPIWRKSLDDTDKYAVPAGFEPDGWKYEWKRVSTFGQPDKQNELNMLRNGWSFVPASRHPGVWMASDDPGNIVVDGQALMEIPMALYQEARREQKMRADRQVNDFRKSAGMMSNVSRDIADRDNPEARKATYVRRESSPVLNQNKYEYTLDE